MNPPNLAATPILPSAGTGGIGSAGTTDKLPVAFSSAPQAADFTGHGTASDMGQNWRVAFRDASGLPLNMQSFEQIDFGAISYKEIFQNVKTIVATPLFSAALERLLGLDARIVDLPIDAAADATVAMLQAIYSWEPRAQAVDISFDADVLNGHLLVRLQLNITNVIFGTDTKYDSNNIDPGSGVDARTAVAAAKAAAGISADTLVTWQEAAPQPVPVVLLPPLVAMPGAPGADGVRGSLWFTGDGAPTVTAGVQAQDMYLDGISGDVYQFDGVSGMWRKRV